MQILNANDNDLIVEIFGTLKLRFKHLLNPTLYYEAGWTDSFCHRRCMHQHATLLEAAECGMTMPAGWYVFAVEDGTPHQLLGYEEDVVNEFRFSKVKKAALERFRGLFI
jgi:hypothetical protein